MISEIKKIAIGSDHNGFDYKEKIKRYLQDEGYMVEDFGQFEENPPAKDFKIAESVALSINRKEYDIGILICGTGDGMCVAANKVPGCIASLCNSVFSATVSRKRNNSNILTLGSKTTSLGIAKKIVKTWLNTDFEDGENEQRNIARNKDLLRIDYKYRKTD